MSKIVAGTAFVLLGGATVAGGVLLHKGSKSDQNTGEETTQTINYDSELPNSLSDFQSKGQTEGCVTSLFSTLEKTDGSGAQTVTADDLKSDYFGTDASKTTEGCLVVNWDKDTYTNKWKGTFRFLWAAQGEDKGFLVFLLGTSSNDGSNKSIKWEGVAYTLNKPTSGNQKWTAVKKHEISATGDQAKSFKKEGTDQNNKFPQSGDALMDVTSKTFWGWFNQTNDMDSICSTSECTTGTPTKASMKGYWQWSGNYGETAAENQKKLSSWTQNIGTWWPEIFGDKFKVHELAEKQVGTWTKRIHSTTNPTTPAPAA